MCASLVALVDPSRNGGYGILYGPNVGVDGVPTDSEGKIAGDEYIAFANDASGRKKVTMMVQVPSHFDPTKACIITAPSSGSRGIYGAVATGEWGLKRGCAVAYTDKGTGTGAHDLQANTVNRIRGERADAAAAGDNSNFTAAVTGAERAAFNAATPNRFAFKHAHSQQNPEAVLAKATMMAARTTGAERRTVILDMCGPPGVYARARPISKPAYSSERKSRSRCSSSRQGRWRKVRVCSVTVAPSTTPAS